MEINYVVFFHPAVPKEDIPRLDNIWRENIKSAIRLKLTTAPLLYGLPLRQSLKGLRKLRVGDYRVIYKIEKRAIRIIIIEHRSVVYKKILKII